MCLKINEKKSLKKALSILLAVTLLTSILAAYAMPRTLGAGDAPDFTVDPASRVADPDTRNTMGFLNSSAHDGRVWTDKTVEKDANSDGFLVTLSALSQVFPATESYVVPADTVFVIDVSGSMGDPDLAIGGAGGPVRIQVLVEALNEAIGILMNANPENRIAVVAYGGVAQGFARAEYVLPLGRVPLGIPYFSYDSNTHYVSVNPAIPISAPYTNRVLVQGSTPTQWGILLGTNILTDASNTNLTIPAMDSDGKPVFEEGTSIPLKVTRKPNIILMTDGEPTMAWQDYLFNNPPTETGPVGTQLNQSKGVYYGDGSNGEIGASLLTVLTAAHRKRLVQQFYFSPASNPAHAGAANKDQTTVGFYTVSLNDGSAPPLIAAAMFPFDPQNTGNQSNADNTIPRRDNQAIDAVGYPPPQPYPTGAPNDSMGSLLRQFASPSPQMISFYARFRVAFGNYRWQNVPGLSNPQNLTLAEMAYSDAYFPANDLGTLRKAFEAITTDIERKSFETVTDVTPGSERFGGYLVFSDILGEYMKFEGLKEFWFDGKAYSRTSFARDIVDSRGGGTGDPWGTYADVLYQQLNYGNMPSDPGHDSSRYVSMAKVVELLESNVDSGHFEKNESVKYYATYNRDFISSFFKADGSGPAPQPEDAAAIVEIFHMKGKIGPPTLPKEQDLIDIVFHVIEVVKDGDFEEVFETDRLGRPLVRPLEVGDQMIRWYIPAALIPQRKVENGVA